MLNAKQWHVAHAKACHQALGRVRRADTPVTMYLPAPPSPLRLPVAIVLGLVAPPLGAIAWIALSGSHRPLYWRSGWIRAGLFLIIGTALPLLAVVVATAMGLTSDSNPNPIGLGLLFFFGGIVGMVLIIIGIIVTARQESRAAERNELGLC